MHSDAQLEALAQLDGLFEGAGIDYWLFGGWAVDFYAGEVTRAHADLDLAIWLADHARVAELLAAAGWKHTPEPAEDGSTAYERAGVRVELAFLARDEDEIFTPLQDGRAAWEGRPFGTDVASLHGVRARVISLSSLKAEKSVARESPTASAKDRADLATLSDLGADS